MHFKLEISGVVIGGVAGGNHRGPLTQGPSNSLATYRISFKILYIYMIVSKKVFLPTNYCISKKI